MTTDRLKKYSMRGKIFGILAIGWLGINLNGQNFKADISALRKKYDGNLSMNISTQIISNDANYPSVTLNGSIKIKGKEMHYKQGDEEVLYTQKYMLLISHSEKNMIFDTATDYYNAAPLSLLHLDSLISAYESVKYQNVGGKKQYTIVPKNSEVESYVITIGVTGLLETASLTLSAEAGGGTALLTYTGFVSNPNYPADEFNPWKYVKKQAGKYMAQEAYKSYNVDAAI